MILHFDQLKVFYEGMGRNEEEGSKLCFSKNPTVEKAHLRAGRKTIEGPLANEGYKDLRFGKPEMSNYVIVDFSLTDGMDGRTEYNSQKTLKKVFKTVLEQTNWRLMSDGNSYRFAILTGCLKAYESDEDLMELIE